MCIRDRDKEKERDHNKVPHTTSIIVSCIISINQTFHTFKWTLLNNNINNVLATQQQDYVLPLLTLTVTPVNYLILITEYTWVYLLFQHCTCSEHGYLVFICFNELTTLSAVSLNNAYYIILFVKKCSKLYTFNKWCTVNFLRSNGSTNAN